VSRYWAFLVPLLCGIGLGAVAVATSPSNQRQPLLAGILVVAVALSILGTPARLVPTTRRNKIVILGAVVVVGLAAVALVHTEIGLRALAPSDQDRTVEWSSALRQFESDPWIGVGPDRLLTFVASDGSYAHYAHNEYLQILADGGIVGAALVALAGVAAVGRIRRYDVVSSTATAGVICWAVAGAFDFDWHLPVIGILGGWILGLATGGPHEGTE
jgi:O-antigen ligase